MRIPRYWIYFILVMYCIWLIFQKNSPLFTFNGFQFSINLFIRLGLLIWIVWLLILGIRGHVIFWSSYPASFYGFYGKSRILYGTFGFGLLLISLGILTNVLQNTKSNIPISYSSTATFRPTFFQTSTPQKPTNTPITFNGIPCVFWTTIDKSDVESLQCIYGKVFRFGPNSNKWSIIQFSSSSDSLRVMDFNYSYTSPLYFGECVIVYGRIRDYGSYLIIAPGLNIPDRIRIGPTTLCE